MNPLDEQDRISFEFGAILRLLSATGRRDLRLGSIEAQLMQPIRLRQVEIVYGPRRLPLAYASWAFVTTEVAARLAKEPTFLLHPSEWNEGTLLWIMDFVALKSRAFPLARALRTRLSARHRDAFSSSSQLGKSRHLHLRPPLAMV